MNIGEIRDRGSKKWTSIIIPQHGEMLDQLWEERKHEDRGELPDQAWEEIQQVVSLALQLSAPVWIRYFEITTHQEFTGAIQKVDLLKRHLILQSSTDGQQRCVIHFDSIVSVELVEQNFSFADEDWGVIGDEV
ncbi:YolD-like family protein [Cohnella soli]|uniref:YolD-like family protein n=1 Tax=Cohnella soli TaxID=425005 RepID=A0ABW0HQ04_9BACL